MTNKDKERILTLRQQGMTYAEIAKATGIRSGSIRTFCWRAGASNNQQSSKGKCIECGAPIDVPSKTKPRKFCSDTCRLRHWEKNPGGRKSLLISTCSFCRKEFKTRYKTQKYCCHDCYIRHRFGEAGGKDV